MMRNALLPIGGHALLFGAVAYAWLSLAPLAALSAYLLNPAYAALVAATLVAPLYAALTALSARSERLERLLLASFLGGMPVVYLWAALRSGDASAVLLELVGLLVYGAWAVLGYRRSTMLLGLGIAAHGIGWDAWHHSHATYIDSWYPLGCLLVDVAFGLAVAAQVYRPGDPPAARARSA